MTAWIAKYFAKIKYRRLVLETIVSGPLPRALQKTYLFGDGIIFFGAGVTFGWPRSPGFDTSSAYIEARRKKSQIRIGENCIFSNDIAIISEYESSDPGITIGNRLVCGSRFRCYDSDFHGIVAEKRHDLSSVKTDCVSIGNDCFIGENVMILKGAHIGNKCVISAGSVIYKGVYPDNSIIAGNPACVIRRINDPVS